MLKNDSLAMFTAPAKASEAVAYLKSPERSPGLVWSAFSERLLLAGADQRQPALRILHLAKMRR